MSALDTNVLIHYLVGGESEQTEAARALNDGLTPEEPEFIYREIVLEIAWVLERSFRFTRTELLKHCWTWRKSRTKLIAN